MEKKTVKITELDVEPLADADLAAIAGAADPHSVCTCIRHQSDIFVSCEHSVPTD
jgi:hypothetical protein